MSQREPGALDVCTVQPTALLDCVVRVASLPAACGCRDTPGGSQRVSRAALAGLLSSYTAQQRAGGSAANVARALAAGFNVSCGVVGAVGSDAAGAAVTACLQNSRVDTSRLITQQGAATGACCVLVEPSGAADMLSRRTARVEPSLCRRPTHDADVPRRRGDADVRAVRASSHCTGLYVSLC